MAFAVTRKDRKNLSKNLPCFQKCSHNRASKKTNVDLVQGPYVTAQIAVAEKKNNHEKYTKKIDIQKSEIFKFKSNRYRIQLIRKYSN